MHCEGTDLCYSCEAELSLYNFPTLGKRYGFDLTVTDPHTKKIIFKEMVYGTVLERVKLNGGSNDRLFFILDEQRAINLCHVTRIVGA